MALLMQALATRQAVARITSKAYSTDRVGISITTELASRSLESIDEDDQ